VADMVFVQQSAGQYVSVSKVYVWTNCYSYPRFHRPAIQPKQTVDLESMAFSQGGHLMSNKKCMLPDSSFKHARKGYKEIPCAETEATCSGWDSTCIRSATVG
jgi:hypothetical protein